MKSNQKGFGIIVILVMIVLVVGVIGLGWYAYRANQSINNTTTEMPADSTTTKEITTKEYSDPLIGISFTYPKEWVTLKCEGRDKTLYLASDNRGIGQDGEASILCGGGTDFPPQATFQLADIGTKYEGSTTPQELVIDGQKALKYVDVVDGDHLRPVGFETTSYFIEKEDGVLVISYKQWPEGTEGYDTSDESKTKFLELIESSLKLL